MVEINFENGNVIFEILGFHKFFAFKSRIIIPRENIVKVHKEPLEFKFWRGIRLPGTHVPGLITAGTFKYKGKKLFWDVSKRHNIIVVDLKNEKYDQLNIEVENPDMVISLLNTSVS